MGTGAAEFVAVLDNVAVEAEEDDVAIVAAKDVVVALCDATAEGLELFQALARRCGNVDPVWRYFC